MEPIAQPLTDVVGSQLDADFRGGPLTVRVLAGRPTVGLAGSVEYDGGMDVSSANLVNDRILAEISQHDGQLGWHEIAIAVGAATVEERSRVFADLVRLEDSGGVRSEQRAGRVRYWIVGTPSQSNKSQN